MTGLPDNNYPAFFEAAARLSEMGYDVVNPADLGHAHDASRHEIMHRDIAALITCDAIYMLDGWKCSCGARLEHEIAREIGLTVECFLQQEKQNEVPYQHIGYDFHRNGSHLCAR
jgi:hypothetical protein